MIFHCYLWYNKCTSLHSSIYTRRYFSFSATHVCPMSNGPPGPTAAATTPPPDKTWDDDENPSHSTHGCMCVYHESPPQPSVELLQWAEATVRSRSGDGQHGDAAVFAKWFDAHGAVSETHTFASLWMEAGRVAHELRVSCGLAKGDRAILCYGFGLDFFAAFLGCLRAGVLAVPVCEWSFSLHCRRSCMQIVKMILRRYDTYDTLYHIVLLLCYTSKYEISMKSWTTVCMPRTWM